MALTPSGEGAPDPGMVLRMRRAAATRGRVEAERQHGMIDRADDA
jgi:hypothetical protein